jgi:hypothetical protein
MLSDWDDWVSCLLDGHVEVDFPGEPLIVGFGEQGCDQAPARIGIGEDRRHARAALDFAIDAFQPIGGS